MNPFIVIVIAIPLAFTVPTGLTYRLTAIDNGGVRYEMRGNEWPIGMEERGVAPLDVWQRWLIDTNGTPANVGYAMEAMQ